MNEQKPPNAIEWTRIRKPDGTYTKGFTWNVVGGCEHECKWEMPNKEVAECYAKTVAERVAQAAYPNGFAHHYWHPERLDEPLRVKEPAGIFIDSMADLMGHWVPDEQVQQVLDVCRKAHWHTFFLLTKNAPRLSKFEFPPNVWVGASSPPDWFMGKKLTREQQTAMLHRTLKTLQEVKAAVRWISFEPLSWDCSEIVSQYPGALTWAVIGAASNGPKEFPPAEADLMSILTVLDGQNVPIFYKGNMRTLAMTANDWRHNFPGDAKKLYNGYTKPLPDTDWGHSEVFPMTESSDFVPPPDEPGDLNFKQWSRWLAESGKPTPPPAPKPTTVVNFQDVKEHWDKNAGQWDSDEYVYIGRGNTTYLLLSSPWSNPFKLQEDTPELRAAAIRNYRTYIEKRLADKGDEMNLEALRGKTLVCWCAPKACHGHVLLQLLGEIPTPPAASIKPEPEPKQMTLFDMPQVKPKHYV